MDFVNHFIGYIGFSAFDVGHLFQTIGAYVGIGATIFAVVMGALSARNKVTINDLQQGYDALKTLHETVKEERDTERSEKHRFEFELEGERSKLELLKNTVTQGPSIEKLILSQASQHKQMMLALSSSQESQAKTAEALAEIASQLTILVRDNGKKE